MGNVINYLKSGGSGGDDEIVKILLQENVGTGIFTIPSGLTNLKYYALQGKNFSNYIFPNDLPNISHGCFSNNHGLVGLIDLSNTSITKIGDSAFSGSSTENDGIEIKFPDTLQTIGSSCFVDGGGAWGRGIKGTLTLPANIVSVGGRCFERNELLTKVKYLGNVPNLPSYNPFNWCSNIELFDFRYATKVPTLGSGYGAYYQLGFKTGCQIVVPDALYDSWIIATNWSTLPTDTTSDKYVVWVKASEYVEATPVTTPDNI